MKKFLIEIFFGKPVKGIPISYGKSIKSTTMPINMSYEEWYFIGWKKYAFSRN